MQTAGAHAFPLYRLIDLGTLGGSSSFALDVNDRQQVTGNSQTPASNPSPRLNAFLWQRGSMSNLGVLPGSNNFSRGYGINNKGVVVGESDNNRPRAFRYHNGVMTDLGTLGGTSAVAHDINDAGEIVGASSNGLASRPFIYRGGVLHDLGTLSGSLNSPGRGWAINQRGDVVGVSRYDDVNFRSHATLWRGGVPGSAEDLGALGDPAHFSQAFGVNNRLQIVGESVYGRTPGGSSLYQAFLWENGVMIGLDSLGFRHSRANDINDSGLIVGHVSGFYNFPTIDGLAVAWYNGTATDLNRLIPADSGWRLRTAEAVNRWGDIVGFGTFQGQTRAYMLQAVPEPGITGLLLGAGAVALLALRRVRR
jgi:probable HAF family extracellular repeat protein